MAITDVFEAPVYEDLIEGYNVNSEEAKKFNAKAKLAWILFFQNIVAGDKGVAFVPVPTNFTITGLPEFSGAYYHNQGWIDFWIFIAPNGGSTSATPGVSYFDLPFDITVDAPCFAVANLSGSNAGQVDAATNRCYVPGWTGVNSPLTVSGRVKV